MECGLVEQIESIILRDNELNQMVNKALHQERCYVWLALAHNCAI